MAIVHTTLELVSQVVHANEVNVSLFDFLHHFLIWINQSDNPGKILFPYLQLRTLEHIGIGLQLSETIRSGTNGKEIGRAWGREREERKRERGGCKEGLQ